MLNGQKKKINMSRAPRKGGEKAEKEDDASTSSESSSESSSSSSSEDERRQRRRNLRLFNQNPESWVAGAMTKERSKKPVRKSKWYEGTSPELKRKKDKRTGRPLFASMDLAGPVNGVIEEMKNKMTEVYRTMEEKKKEKERQEAEQRRQEEEEEEEGGDQNDDDDDDDDAEHGNGDRRTGQVVRPPISQSFQNLYRGGRHCGYEKRTPKKKEENGARGLLQRLVDLEEDDDRERERIMTLMERHHPDVYEKLIASADDDDDD